MPVVTFEFDDFINLLGYEISKKKLVEKIPMIGADLDKVEGNEINIEFFPNRPDLTSVEGIVRAARSFLDFEKGMKKYPLEKSDITLNVEPSVKKVRPYISTALVKNVTMNDRLIASLMQLQEKLHFGLGRNRQKVAIGVHNYEPIKPPFLYKAVDPDSLQFVPLGKIESMTLSKILRKHEKGKEYRHILEGFKKHPIILDSNDNVLSYPPIINGILTEVTPFTKDLFIDVTGTDKKAVNYALNIVVTALAERDGKLYSTQVKDVEDDFFTPDLKTDKKDISVEYVNKILGTDMDKQKVIESLEKMGYKTTQKNNRTIKVEIPPWRSDILHEIDLVEDVAIGYGFQNFEYDLPKSMTFGKNLPDHNLHETLRTTMIGLGFNEVNTFTITNERDEYKKFGLKEEEKRVRIKNPIGEEYTCIRTNLLPSLMKILKKNRHHNLPQKIFELGIVVEDGVHNTYHLSAAKIDAKANFTECKSIVEAVLNEIDIDYKLENGQHPGFIKGRCALIKRSDKDKEIGIFGELHPKTITEFELSHPTIAFELKTKHLK
ncbi:MAG: phenylalanine--tRNA ligase subunit beta [Candidatus Thermoplasmatota archaeon]